MKPKKVITKNVTLLGGPMHGQQVAVPRGSERFIIGKPGRVWWTYTYAGKLDRKELFAIQPSSRLGRRFIFWYVGQNGKDPRVEAFLQKPVPRRNAAGEKNAKRGKAARARAAKRVA